MTPNYATKLAEKLGFRIENARFIRNNEEPPYNRIALSSEIALWNLCLELSERLERFEDLRKAADEACFFLGTVWTAQSLNTPNEKTTHHVWTNLQKALTDLPKQAADPERKDA